MLLELRRLRIPPGQRVLLQDVSWQEFEEILAELGEDRAARIAYDRGTLEIMTPLPEHESAKELVSDLLKALLEELDIEFLTLGSTTFKNQWMAKGIEPDNCFYIHNEERIRGKRTLDLAIDPPPDLAIEIDVTSRTHLEIYQALGVPELWRFENGTLQINILQDGQYISAQCSLIFPNISLTDVIPNFVKQCQISGRNQTLKLFRTWVRERL
ncbi:Uma2 family endonuclease [Desertifilum sp. FACHB-1129]|uniref:Uma2 family endonuclease n=2 Tax=Desertifilum tharense IPPAS B-1220 TaxID=1781255 RepID=A0ACD5GYD9_9CYAN|nr:MULTISPECIES: Uma2 family endonuclease [Desertifilum]MDA0212843.1 Uma2 family endonuclease [Cyanobacteria bacterium FC1]MBD2314451.1 Uma2 family endonuclease [Desertifilum sp. FACHB-1129]MBD2321700.1 Uma2 family endonuclease [Desertifilum sp. FACHB-866]MBD2331827.1 Uma2 family endonuclease [Desertifilum sp. FACHB-868]OEJ75384.1 hypothetical protein BH720_09690 [Desertifilum tharense IPPAS B-1220]